MSLDGITDLREAFRRSHVGPADPPVVLSPEPRDTASRFAAPVWALVWLLTFGKFGRPLWRRRKREPVTTEDLALLPPRARAMWLMQAAQGCPPPHPRVMVEAERRWREPGGAIATLEDGVEYRPLPPAGFRGDVLAAGYRGPDEARAPTVAQIPWYPPKPPPPWTDPGREMR